MRRRDVKSDDIPPISKYNSVAVWHKLYLHHQPLPFAPLEPPRRDVVRASPPILDPRGRLRRRAAWDVALFLEKPNRLRKSLLFVLFHALTI